MASEQAQAWAGMSPAERASNPAMWAEMTPEQRAESIGLTHGRNAGNGVFDGNTPRSTYEAVVKGLEDGDPEVYDAFRPPDLSGEYGDDYNETELIGDTGYAPSDEEDEAEAHSEIANAYNDAASEGFWGELERVARYQTEPDREAE